MSEFRGHAPALAVGLLVAIFNALAPFVHGLIHPDHAIVAALHIEQRAPHCDHHKPAQPAHQGTDCALYQAYVHPGGHAPPPSVVSVAPAPLVSAYAPELLPLAMPAGAPRGIALGRGPPLQS